MTRLTISRALLACAFCFGLGLAARAQSPRAGRASIGPAAPASTEAAPSGNAGLEEVKRALLEQQEEIKRMRALIEEQSQVISELRQRVEETAGQAATVNASNIPVSDRVTPQAPPAQQDTEERLARVEGQTRKTHEALMKQLGSITFSGDLRLRYEGFFGQLNALSNAENPAALGNELSTRNRFRVRARLAIRGKVGENFDWGLRLATGSLANSVSANQTLTDFFTHKPFGIDQAYLAWTPRRVPGLRIQGGKFEVPWTRTELTIDNDLNPDGFSQTYSRDFKNSALKNLTLTAWQLPMLERTSAFVRNPDGTVNVSQSRRGGRDLALYGAQVRARFEPAEKVGLTLSLADLYFSGTQFITPIQFFGSQLQLPVTVTIPATATTPAQTVTTQVAIPRDFLVPGNGNLGVSVANTNATGRDGRLSSGYNLVDVIGRLDLTHSKRWPVMLLLDFVTNTQARDVSVAGPGGSTVFLNNDENHGYWAEAQVGKTRERGDWLFGYAFIRLEKDAVLTPFNYSDLIQQSDIRTHRFQVNYAADPRVVLTLTGIVTQRANGLLGPFGTTLAGSLNQPTTRIQFDTLFRF
ncbi:MAG TPA: putative porin [Pyrinomonadaceae bacterium]|nr:putative porin [Pyrinomonadaceae bacterium]